MTLDPVSLLQGFTYATVGLALMFGLPYAASKHKHGLPLLAIAAIFFAYYAHEQGWIGY